MASVALDSQPVLLQRRRNSKKFFVLALLRHALLCHQGRSENDAVPATAQYTSEFTRSYQHPLCAQLAANMHHMKQACARTCLALHQGHITASQQRDSCVQVHSEQKCTCVHGQLPHEIQMPSETPQHFCPLRATQQGRTERLAKFCTITATQQGRSECTSLRQAVLFPVMPGIRLQLLAAGLGRPRRCSLGKPRHCASWLGLLQGFPRRCVWPLPSAASRCAPSRCAVLA